MGIPTLPASSSSRILLPKSQCPFNSSHFDCNLGWSGAECRGVMSCTARGKEKRLNSRFPPDELVEENALSRVVEAPDDALHERPGGFESLSDGGVRGGHFETDSSERIRSAPTQRCRRRLVPAGRARCSDSNPRSERRMGSRLKESPSHFLVWGFLPYQHNRHAFRLQRRSSRRIALHRLHRRE